MWDCMTHETIRTVLCILRLIGLCAPAQLLRLRKLRP